MGDERAIDVPRQIAYWRDGSEEDLDAARVMLDAGKFRHGMFFAHLAVEKMLKAHVVRKTEQVPPKTHKLSRLAELGGIALSEEQQDFLADFMVYLLEGRYPDMPSAALVPESARRDFKAAERMIEWLKHLL